MAKSRGVARKGKVWPRRGPYAGRAPETGGPKAKPGSYIVQRLAGDHLVLPVPPPPPVPLVLRRTDDKPRRGSFPVPNTPAAPRLRALRPDPLILLPGHNAPRPMGLPIGQPDSSIVVATSVGVTGGLGTALTMVPADLNFGPLAEITEFTIVSIDSGTF